jgi:hypothetical protein
LLNSFLLFVSESGKIGGIHDGGDALLPSLADISFVIDLNGVCWRDGEPILTAEEHLQRYASQKNISLRLDRVPSDQFATEMRAQMFAWYQRSLTGEEFKLFKHFFETTAAIYDLTPPYRMAAALDKSFQQYVLLSAAFNLGQASAARCYELAKIAEATRASVREVGNLSLLVWQIQSLSPVEARVFALRLYEKLEYFWWQHPVTMDGLAQVLDSLDAARPAQDTET